MNITKELKPIKKNYIWGKEACYGTPDCSNAILVKHIQTHAALSLQVHPDNKYAFNNENKSLGKTEVWLIINAASGAGVYFGFNNSYTKEEIKQFIKDGALEKTLTFYPVKTGDIFLVEPGIVHAIGADIELIETQQNSDITYRLYDYNRVDKDGLKRELHLNKALDVVKLNRPETPIAREWLLLKDKAKMRVICKLKEFSMKEYIVQNTLALDLSSAQHAIVYILSGNGAIDIGGQKFNYDKNKAFLVSKKDSDFIIKPNTTTHIIVNKTGE